MSPLPLHVSRLTLTDFRSYPALSLTAGPGPVVICGDNGAGKTNILEAPSLLAPGRGLRGAALAEMARIGGAGGFAVAAALSIGAEAPVDIGTGTRVDAPDRRVVRINGAAAAATALAEWLSLVWLTPAMDRLFADTAGARRRFLDRLTLALVPDHGHHAARYEAAMRARTRLLTQDAPADPAWLAALERQMADHGQALAAARAQTVAGLAERLASQPQGPFPAAGLAIEGGAADIELAGLLERSRGRDAAAGRATVGPHRADLLVRHLPKDQPAGRCSTGEQKALLLGLILAHAELVAARTGKWPLLLLDEVAAHLDGMRREALFGRLGSGHAQVWMTGTDRALFEGVRSDATFIAIRDGRLEVE